MKIKLTSGTFFIIAIVAYVIGFFTASPICGAIWGISLVVAIVLLFKKT